MTRTLLTLFSLSWATLHAQTTGPTQPEVSSFTPAGVEQMVDMYTGDFQYNLPLLVVPGPDGGYPINLSYHSDINAMDVATWVGLGFQLNAGAIVRHKRGIPDDFRGDGNQPDVVEKTTYLKPKKNIAFGLSALDLEITSADVSYKELGNFSIYYDNYDGFGVLAGLDLLALSKMSESKMVAEGYMKLGLNFDSKEGIRLSPKISVDKLFAKKEEATEGEDDNKNKGLGTFIKSMQGKVDKLRTFTIPYKGGGDPAQAGSYSQKFKLSFAKHAPLAPISLPRSTVSVKFATTLDVSLPFPKIKATKLEGNLTISRISQPTRTVGMYGALYTAEGQNDEQAITDFFREGEVPLTKEAPLLPVTIQSFDIFSIQAQGVGGSFRLYQNSVGQYKPQTHRSVGHNVEVGLDFGAGAGSFDLGADMNYAHTRSYTSAWKDRRINSLQDFHFRDHALTSPLFEPSYFKIIGEAGPLPLAEWKDIEKDRPIAFDLGSLSNLLQKPFTFKAKALGTYNGGNNKLSPANYKARLPRTTSIEYKTKRQVLDRVILDDVYEAKHIIKENNTLSAIDYFSQGKDHHIHEISVRKPNGTVYHFALPAYNKEEEKITYATRETDGDGDKMVPYHASEAQIANGLSQQLAGSDEFYSKEVMPAYVHTYFLTSILSYDYIDTKNDGPTDDDLGGWTKFYYHETPDYQWRFPYDDQRADFIEGYLTNEHDNKATFTSGLKNLYYVKAIETKTHIAVFKTAQSALADARHAKAQKYLTKISLYSKADSAYTSGFFLSATHTLTPIKEVHFAYDYSLKANPTGAATVPNFDATLADTDNLTTPLQTPGQNGTLTLKQLWFTYQQNKTGADARYHFDYAENKPHPIAYAQDRWGAYQPALGNFDPYENPYTYQGGTATDRQQRASLWCLSRITLPSDGEIHITYEKDDYTFVQNRPAQEFVPIKGFGSTGGGVYDLSSGPVSSLKDLDKIYFEAANLAEAKARVKDIDDIGFRVFMYLNHVKSLGQAAVPHQDYVSGYLLKDYVSDVGWDAFGGYVKIKNAKPTSSSLLQIHPFQLATLQYIRQFRPDIQTSFDFTVDDPIAFASKFFGKLYNAVKPLFSGYYQDKYAKGWGSKVRNERPSFLRLNSLKQKYGGGNRVKRIEMWSHDHNQRKYGKVYDYRMPDGSSSGVAEMEPLTGHEENALVRPEWYDKPSGRKALLIQKETENAFVELPIGLSLYPGAKVGYRRVVERSLPDEQHDVSLSQDGVTVHEFYTAKDYPTRARKTEHPFQTKIPGVKLAIPFIGQIGINNGGFSMGYVFNLNNAIYGRQKRVSVHPYTIGEPLAAPVSSTAYVYQHQNEYELDNKVKLLKKEGDVVEAYLGKSYDFYIDQYETGSVTIGGGVRPDIKFNPLFVPWPSLLPTIQYYENTSSYVTTTKVIYDTPILEKIVHQKDGSQQVFSNLYYDYESGQPIITGLTNEFQNTVYSYRFPAHWTYDRMDGAYKNYGAFLDIEAAGSKVRLKSALANCADLLYPGDELMIGQQKYFVSDVDRAANDFALHDRSQNALTFGGNPTKLARIERSGFRNLQSLTKGGIVSLQDYSNRVLNDPTLSGGDVLRLSVLQADALEYTEESLINFAGLPNNSTDVGLSLPQIYNGSAVGANPYAFGKAGIPRSWRNWAYIQDRAQSGSWGDQVDISQDGTFRYIPFDWTKSYQDNEQNHWRWVNEVSRYNAAGHSEEGKNRLQIYAASLTGYRNHLVTAAAQNAKQHEIAFDSFEDYAPGETINHGNFNFNLSNTTVQHDVAAHTGNKALFISSTASFSTGSTDFFRPVAGKKYVISAWVYVGTPHHQKLTFNGGEIEVWEGGSRLALLRPDFTKHQVVDGWLKIEDTFTPSSSNVQFRLRPLPITSTITGGQAGIFDDIRIHPFHASMQTYVYDPATYRLRATLNDHNYYTAFIYDSEGSLIQKNVETETGKFTLSVNRTNVSRK